MSRDKEFELLFAGFRYEFLNFLINKKLKLSFPIILLLFLFICFGLSLLFNHFIDNIPLPQNIGDIFDVNKPYIYPNLTSFIWDFMNTPLTFLMCILLGKLIPEKIRELYSEGIIQIRSSMGFLSKLIRSNHFLNFITITRILLSVIFLLNHYAQYKMANFSGFYSLFLTFFGNYAAIVLFSYIIIVLIQFNFCFEININKISLFAADRCGGFSNFSRIGFLLYSILFFWGFNQIIAEIMGGSNVSLFLGNPQLYLYLWLLFPFFVMVIFNDLIYKPHLVLKKYKENWLKAFSHKNHREYQRISINDDRFFKLDEKVLSSRLNKLDIARQYMIPVKALSVWPIRKSFGNFTVIFSPIIPVLTPVLVELLKRVLL